MDIDEIKLSNIDSLSELSGLPESIMANDMVSELEKELVRMGKPDKDAATIIHKLSEAYAKEREQTVQACYMAGYLKGLADMAQRMKHMLANRDETETRSGEARKKVV
ncbi:MAG: hypothetical protein ABFD46_04055 [Armatimonadota bacterium]